MKSQSTFSWSRYSRRAHVPLVISAAVMCPTASQAESFCWTNAGTGMFECLDVETNDVFSLTGNIPPAASPDIMYDGLRYQTYTLYSFSLVASGRIRTSDQFDYPFLFITGGNVILDARNSVIVSEGGSNVALRVRAGDELNIWSGSVRNDGAFAYGIAADAGRIEIHGGRTVVGHTSVGIFAQSNYGDAIVHTGHIDARQFDATGAVAFAKDWGDGYGCGTAIVNVDGSVIGAAYGVRAIGCADTDVNVAQRGRVAAFGSGTAIQTDGVGTSRVNVDGVVIARGLRALAVDQNGQNSSLTIGNGGLVEGRFDGTHGIDIFTIRPGGTWQTRGQNDFGSGPDLLRNEGDVRIEHATTLAGLERFENWGRLRLASSSMNLPRGILVNRGTIDLTGVATVLTPRGFINGGTLHMANGVVGDHLQISDQLTNLSNSRVTLDVGAAGADQFSIRGTVSGQMVVDAFLLADAPLIMSPTLMVSAAAAGDDTFVLGRVVGNSTSLVDYRLFREGDGFYLSSALSQRAAKPLKTREFESTLWRSSVSSSLLDTAFRNARGWTFQALGTSSHPVLVEPGSRMFESVVPAGQDAGSALPVAAKFRFSQDAANSGWFVSAGGGYYHTAPAGSQRDSIESGLNLQGMVGLQPNTTGWYGALSVAAMSFNTNFNDPEWQALRGSRRTTSAGAIGTLGYRQSIGEMNTDWTATASVRHVASQAFSLGDILLQNAGQTRIALEAGANLSLGGALDPMIKVSAGMEIGRRPELYASLEGHNTRFKSSGNGHWIHAEASLNSKEDRAWSLSLTADIQERTEGSLVAQFSF